jgi:hypothetical protein
MMIPTGDVQQAECIAGCVYNNTENTQCLTNKLAGGILLITDYVTVM